MPTHATSNRMQTQFAKARPTMSCILLVNDPAQRRPNFQGQEARLVLGEGSCSGGVGGPAGPEHFLTEL